MKRIVVLLALGLSGSVVAQVGRPTGLRIVQSSPDEIQRPATHQVRPGDHSYFESLRANRAFWKGTSLRDPAELVSRNLGGYAQKDPPYYVTYDPAQDREPQAQDAAKIVVPAWGDRIYVLESDLEADATSLTASWIGPSGWNSRSLKFDDGEIVTVPPKSVDGATKTLRTLLRGQFGTTARRHRAGSTFLMNGVSLPNQVRVPVGTENGHRYLFTWDFYCTDSCAVRPVPGKTFQLASRGIWLEQQVRPDGKISDNNRVGKTLIAPGFVQGRDAGSWAMRSYNRLGGNATWSAGPFPSQSGPGIMNGNPLGPAEGSFVVKTGRFIRVWILIDQRVNDYDYMSSWAGDRETGIVQVHNRLPLSLRAENDTIEQWYIEVNTSDDNMRSQTDLVMYVRNFVVLKDVSDPTAFLRTDGL